MYAKDFQRIIDDAMKDMALTVKEVFAENPPEESTDPTAGGGQPAR